MKSKRSVVIVGAGMAGVTAARDLADNGNFDVIVLEADPKRYGGRMYSYEVPGTGGKACDMGAMWIHGGTHEDHPIVQLCKRYGIKLSDKQDQMKWIPGNVGLLDEQGKPLAPDQLDETINVVAKFMQNLENGTEEMVKNNSDMSVRTYLNEVAEKDPTFVNHHTINQIAVPSFEAYMAALVDDMSLKLMHGIPDSPERVEYDGGDLWIPTGYRTLLDKMVTVGPPFKLHLDRRVERIKVNRDHPIVEITCSDIKGHSHQYTADHMIVTVPLGVLKARTIHFDPELPPSHMRAIDRIGFGTRTKVVLLYDRVFWPDQTAFFLPSKRFPLHWINLKKLYGINGILAAFDARGAVSTEAMTDEAIVQVVTDRLTAMVGIEKIQQARLLHYKIIKWGTEPHFRGAYSFGKIGMKHKDAYAIRQPILPHLFFAGEHTTYPDSVPGTVLAAYVSGKRAAQEVITFVKSERSKL